jgi:hypothetical protein
VVASRVQTRFTLVDDTLGEERRRAWTAVDATPGSGSAGWRVRMGEMAETVAPSEAGMAELERLRAAVRGG